MNSLKDLRTVINYSLVDDKQKPIFTDEEKREAYKNIESSLEVFEIIKEKRVDTQLFDIPDITLEKYNSLISYRKDMILTQEQFDKVKKELEK